MKKRLLFRYLLKMDSSRELLFEDKNLVGDKILFDSGVVMIFLEDYVDPDIASHGESRLILLYR
jgi:hypothetical protein